MEGSDRLSRRRSLGAPATWSTRKRRRRASSTSGTGTWRGGQSGTGSGAALLPHAGTSFARAIRARAERRQSDDGLRGIGGWRRTENSDFVFQIAG